MMHHHILPTVCLVCLFGPSGVVCCLLVIRRRRRRQHTAAVVAAIYSGRPVMGPRLPSLLPRALKSLLIEEMLAAVETCTTDRPTDGRTDGCRSGKRHGPDNVKPGRPCRLSNGESSGRWDFPARGMAGGKRGKKRDCQVELFIDRCVSGTEDDETSADVVLSFFRCVLGPGGSSW